MKDLIINYEGNPCYKICFRPSFDDLIQVFNSEVNHQYDKICIVTDSNVSKLYLDDVISCFNNISDKVFSFVFEAGEASKNLDTVNMLYEHLIINKFTRNSLLVALGGGVVGDLTGFAASTFLRGIDFIQIPTTLLSQVDSSVGGKTGVDFKGYKNMIGAFYMPRLVYMNIGTLSTLDDNNFACGMGEVIKSALIADKDKRKALAGFTLELPEPTDFGFTYFNELDKPYFPSSIEYPVYLKSTASVPSAFSMITAGLR